jgi:hypothetical protein
MDGPNVAIVDNSLLRELIAEIKVMGERVDRITTQLKEAKKPYLNVQELMELTGFGKTWVNDNKHVIGFSTVGGCLRFKRKDVEALMEENYFKAKKGK